MTLFHTIGSTEFIYDGEDIEILVEGERVAFFSMDTPLLGEEFALWCERFLQSPSYQKIIAIESTVGLDKDELKKQLQDWIEQHQGMGLYNGFQDGYQTLTQLRIETLANKEKIAKFDEFKKHILVERIYKPHGKVPHPFTVCHSDEALNQLDEWVDHVVTEGEIGLIYFFDNGEEYGFNDYDGTIRIEFILQEKEEYVDVMAYYAYYGK